MPTPLKYFIYSIIHYIISFFNKNIIINNIFLLLIMQIKSIIKAFKIHFFLILKAFYILHFYFLYYIL
ncbi:hypothetical protein E1H25_07005 [Clostridioides difficile]|nr:hypothetical protein E1H25_07005 [Clostridioides difficile]